MRMIRAIIGLLLAVGAAAPAGAEPPSTLGVIGDDDRRALVDDDPRWRAVGRLNREAGGFCTAVLVAPSEILTAAHCLWDARHRRWFAPDRVHFVPGYRRGAYAGHARGRDFRRAEHIEFTPEGSPRLLDDDWAIVKLDRDLQAEAGIVPLPLAGRLDRENLNGDSRLARVGYGQDRPHLPVIVEPCRLLAGSDGARILLHDCDATFGDSGSPIMLEHDGSYAVLGVQSAVIERDDMTAGAAVMIERIVPASGLR